MAIVYICQEWRAKATDKPAYPPGLKPQRLAAGFVLSLAPAHVARQIRRSVGLPDTPGLLVQNIAVPGPASRAGLQEGDLIVSAGGAEIRSIESLHKKLVEARGSTLSLEVLRGIERHVLYMPVDEPAAV